MIIHNGDFGDNHWLLLIEDSRGLGSVLGYIVYEREADAHWADRGVDMLCDTFGLFVGETVPEYVVTEVMTYGDFKASYGNRMPLHNRLVGVE